MANHKNHSATGSADSDVTQLDMLISALDTLLGGVIVLDAQKRIVVANCLAASLLDIPEHLVQPGADFCEFARFAANRGDYGEGDPEMQYHRVMSVLEYRQPYELTRRRPDGVVLEINGQPIAGGGYVTRFRDVTAVKRQEAQLADAKEASQRFRRFFELSQEMLGIASPEGYLHTMNSAWTRLLGWSAQELQAKPFIQFAAGSDAAAVKAALDSLLAGKDAVAFSGRFQRKNGSHKWLEWNITTDSDGELFCVVHDVDELREQQEELEQVSVAAQAASISKADFLATMSHEIRTPLNGVIGMANLLLDTDLESKQRHYAQSVVESGEALLAIIDDILDISKMEAGKLELDEQEFSVAKVVRSVMDVVTPRALEKRLELAISIAPALDGMLCGDAGKLRQILLNLVGNSIKFTDAGSVSIRVTVTDEDTMQQTLRFEIDDTGIGIPEAVRPHLFMPFSQGESATARKYGGTGLGLSICKQLTQLMDGDIGYDSEVGAGSTFWFTVRFDRAAVPTTAVAAKAEAADGSDASAVPAGGSSHGEAAGAGDTKVGKPNSLRVLLVEDNAVNQMLATAILKKAGHRVDLAADGVEGVEAVRNNFYDVVLMDIQMPNMDGLEATRRIRAMDDPAKANVYIVAITANALLGDRETCLSTGMNDYLPKPIDQKRLLAALDLVNAGIPDEPEMAAPDEGVVAIIDEDAIRNLNETVGAKDLADMVAITTASAPATMALIQAASAQGDLDKINREAHDMGNSFGQFGAARLHAHIVELTTACREGRTARASMLVDQMPDILDEAVAAIKQPVNSSGSRVA